MNVLLLETIAVDADARLRAETNVLQAGDPAEGCPVAARHDVHAIVTRGKGDVSAELIHRCPNLKVIARCGVGLDNVDVAAATAGGIPVLNTPGENADSVAEHTLGLLLSLQRGIWYGVTSVKNGNWAARGHYQGDEIRGKTLGIVGYGNIGRRVAVLARAFGMEVIHWARPRVRGEDEERGVGLPLDDLLERADVVSLHLPLTEDTRHLINAAALARMKPSALLINTARGALVDHAALLESLQNCQLAGYAADLFDPQPPPEDDLLLALPNVLVTPHAASLTARTYDRMCSLAVDNVLNVLNGRAVEARFVANGVTPTTSA